MSTIDEVKAKIDIVDLVSEAGVKLRHAGRNYTGFCPFHENKHTPAFVVWPETGTWRCFGACNEGGDIFKFVMKKEGIDFKEALNKLADRVGVKVESFQREAPEQKEAHEHLRKLLEDAVVFYRSHLFNNKDVLTYLREKRKLTDATIEIFGLGYAPRGYETALKHFTARGYTEQELIDSGLLTVRESEERIQVDTYTGTQGEGTQVDTYTGTQTEHAIRNTQHAVRIYDRFRHRIMIPIRDEQGRMAGFGARIVDPNDIPKFLNSPETPIFSKGRLLYGLDRARKPIRAVDQAVIVEGYLDVIALHQAGYENVVSPMGTALTEDQLRLLKRSTKNMVLALDPDVAGQKAVFRGLDAARQSLDRQNELFFDVRGLLKHEARLNANIKVVVLPDDLDPDELVARDKAEWATLVEKAQPIVLHVMSSASAGRNLDDRTVKNDIAAQVLPLINDLPDPIERDTYLQKLARLIRVDESVLVGLPSQGPAVRRTRPVRREQAGESAPVTVAASSPNAKVEAYCLGILFRRPELLYRLDRQLQEAGLLALASEDFEYTDYQIFIKIIRQSLEQVESDQHQYVVIHLPDSLKGLAQELLTQTEKLDPAQERLLEELQRLVQKLRRTRANLDLTQTRFLQEEAQQNGDPRASLYQQQVLQLTKLIHSIDQANRRLTSKR
jgi:DNA primase